ncbi:MAG: ATP-dependent DNA helicase RecG [Candidatus Kaiserbacteria bacterium GW2011_GWB1_52_6]|uniref:Probable DNA 3'-5' helicase RecG n=2 Tax=Candidatus Kaiseribacteriota TaxID=1752734 RepID=A0A0G1ZID9_9BACT|nr:MAG: ATP-dependent DNA helicase RecG [Candidatus Kaiserbacteria bacterium GW2011_GWA2_52_12]KKW27732.1 MAG: ATP-dependent DNA helicase RecG [Candidatus Kaiserbacteria bacterium GW2011_GWB1_52_6]
MLPHDPLTKHFRLTTVQLSALKRLGISSIEELLRHFPARYDQGGSESAIAGLVAGTEVTIFGTIGNLETRRSWKRKIPVGEAVIRDASGSIKIMWFHQPYLAKKFHDGMYVKAIGTVTGKTGKPYLANPHVEVADPSEVGLFADTKAPATAGKLFAIYPESRGVTSLWFRHALERVFANGVHSRIDDSIPTDIRARYNLPDIGAALVWIHTPEKMPHAEAARKRFAFEEIFTIQVTRARERAENDTQSSFPIKDGADHAERFLSTIPFSPTSAQKRAIKDILDNFSSPHPMARLLEGDVGSGKTLVAATSAHAVVNSRPPNRQSGTLQVAYMAPTEILAQQHFQSFIEFFSHLPINIALMTGSGCKKFPSKVSKGKATDISRAQLLKWVASGEIAMLVGTHALIQKAVKFQHLAFCIVDEQHRFGTRQRRALAHKGDAAPHFLSMTATPIPRTLALTIYGDLDISVLDELPPGRAKVKTVIVTKEKRAEAYESVRRELASGRQAFVICPRIEEPDPAKIHALQAKSAKAEAKRLQKDIFPEFRIGLLHGSVKPAEKDEVMRQFAAHEIDILVATSVVEVGINVPNATVMLIEGAERFGLAQLHQLRGRIMRSSHPPHCFLLPETAGEVAMKRLRALEKSDDGFKLAEADLENRGAGDLFGRQQWGVTDLGMEALKNPRLIAAARAEAQKLVAKDPSLSNYPALAQRVASAGQELHGE